MDEFQSMVEETKALYKGNKKIDNVPDFYFWRSSYI